ncbi:MAG TPA: ATP-dependent DNA helicase [Burkholderiaceae bacterium]|nr:ATP-dependent DNA helicase [Burkholderiaceae bacterium]
MSAYTIAVRELCAFTAKAGDLDLRFTPSPSSDEGIAGHKAVAARRGATYRAEVPVQDTYEDLIVRGRADGFDQTNGVVEEVKTFKGDLARLPENQRALHWAQAKLYGAMLCREFGMARLTVRLVYFDVDSGEETTLEQGCDAAALADVFAAQCRTFLQWARSELAHRAARDAAFEALKFTHPDFRIGQRKLAEQAYLAAKLGRVLLAQAGTGIGKTLATLFSTLKAMPTQRIDKVFFLTAKSSGHAPPLAALGQLVAANGGAPVRVLELVAKSKACEHPDKACHGESCPLARGFYDRLPQARHAAAQSGALAAADVRRLAQAHAICPYYLAQEMARWSDVVVADYNYLLDATALLHTLTVVNGWRVALLIDEAHNLIDRARAMYSVTLSRDELRAAARTAPESLKKTMLRLGRAWSSVSAGRPEPYEVEAAVPERFAAAAGDVCSATSDALAAAMTASEPQALDPDLLEFYFKLLQFRRLADTFGSHSIFDIATLPGRGRSELTIRNVIPATHLKPRFAAMSSAVLFSATLQPQQFYADMLGLPKDAGWVDVEAPFSTEQLAVRVVTHLSTRFAARGRSAQPIAELIAAQFRAQPGNYLAFFSSFDYLEMVAQRLAETCPDVPLWKQHRTMRDADRAEFLARFTPEGAGVGFAVLGGSFAEGIDLPGRRLIGAFIATLGMPQVNAVNDQYRRTIDAELGSGFEYTYLYPGLRKVVQAAGRVIRTATDTGTLYLIDERFGRAAVRALLPAWWSPAPLSAAA